MKSDGSGLLGFFIASPSFYLLTLLKVFLLHYSVYEFSSDMLRVQIDCRGTMVDLEVRTACEISLPSFLMKTRTCPRHYFAAGNEVRVL